MEEKTVEFLVNPFTNKIWAVLMPDGELLDDLVSIKRSEYCVVNNDLYWINPFGGTYHWVTKKSEPYEEEFYKFKRDAQAYMCIFGLNVSDLQYIDYSPISGELIFDEEILKGKLTKDYTDFVNLMKELWEYEKEK